MYLCVYICTYNWHACQRWMSHVTNKPCLHPRLWHAFTITNTCSWQYKFVEMDIYICIYVYIFKHIQTHIYIYIYSWHAYIQLTRLSQMNESCHKQTSSTPASLARLTNTCSWQYKFVEIDIYIYVYIFKYIYTHIAEWVMTQVFGQVMWHTHTRPTHMWHTHMWHTYTWSCMSAWSKIKV